MTEGIIIGVITALSAVLCQIIIAKNNAKNVQRTQFDSQRLIEYKIDRLQEKVMEHNNIIRRQFILEEKMKVTEHRISDLESK